MDSKFGHQGTPKFGNSITDRVVIQEAAAQAPAFAGSVRVAKVSGWDSPGSSGKAPIREPRQN